MTISETYIARCIEIAKNALGIARPNPMVGCVIVHNELIIGEGFTSAYGGPHAEVNAINSVTDKSLLKEATLYVTLEPCSHFGKTPPCSDLIIKHKIPNIVIGTMDTHSKVAGQGIEKLKRAGCNVKLGVLEAACQAHHKRFLCFHNKQRPYIILKWAATQDGFIAPASKKENKPVWISSTLSRQLVHKWRAEEQAILVGANTVIQDDPSLNLRDWAGQQPIRIVIDKFLSLSKQATIFKAPNKTYIISSNSAYKTGFTAGNLLEKRAHIEYACIDFEKPLAAEICKILHDLNISSLIVEGGSKTLQAFIDADLWDEARVFTANSKFNSGISAPVLKGQLKSEAQIGSDLLKIYLND